METKTVCFFNSTQAWGGGEKWHFDMATRLASASYRVVVCTHPRSALYERLRDTGLKVYPVSISNLHASIYHAMGMTAKHHVEIEKRPFYVTKDGLGEPVLDLFA